MTKKDKVTAYYRAADSMQDGVALTCETVCKWEGFLTMPELELIMMGVSWYDEMYKLSLEHKINVLLSCAELVRLEFEIE